MYIYIYIYMHIYIYIYVYVRVCVYIYIYIYTPHIHITINMMVEGRAPREQGSPGFCLIQKERLQHTARRIVNSTLKYNNSRELVNYRGLLIQIWNTTKSLQNTADFSLKVELQNNTESLQNTADLYFQRARSILWILISALKEAIRNILQARVRPTHYL